MKLIDANALGLELTESMRCTMCCNPMHNEFGCDGNCMIPNEGLLQAVCKSITDSIDRQKEIDVVNNKHGRWIKSKHGDNWSDCSYCGATTKIRAYDIGVPKYFYRYCPQCGARMDEAEIKEHDLDAERR